MTRVIVYRISSGGYAKAKPDYITKESCFLNFIRELLVARSEAPKESYQLYIIEDNCKPELKAYVRKVIDTLRVGSSVAVKIAESSIGHGAGSFVLGVHLVLKDKTLENDDAVYFLEDDYLHVPKGLNKIFEIVESGFAQYSTGYDHPDKYGTFDTTLNRFNSPNPFVDVLSGSELATEVYLIDGYHWKKTHSTTMTFCTSIKTLKEDFDTCIGPFVSGTHPEDFDMWTALELVQKRRLVSPVPSLSTHGETAWLAPCVDWAPIGTKALESSAKMKDLLIASTDE